MRLDDVRFKRCITCGAPSKQGLCKLCMRRPVKRVFAPEESVNYAPAADGRGTRSQKRSQFTGEAPWVCGCDECQHARTKTFEPTWWGKPLREAKGTRKR